MPIEVEFHSEPEFLLVTWSGEITEEEAIKAGDLMESHPNFRIHLNRINDFRKARFNLPPDAIRRVVKAWDERDHVHGVRKNALIVDDVLSSTMLTMFKILKDKDFVKIIVTKDMDEAKAWVESSERFYLVNGKYLELPSLSFLVVDDEVFIQKLAVRILGQMGATDVETATNGKEALDHISSAASKPDVLLVDLNMPIMGGVELLRHLAESNFSGAIILVSGSDEETLAVAEGLAKSRDVNVLGYITKPISPQSLTDVLNKLN